MRTSYRRRTITSGEELQLSDNLFDVFLSYKSEDGAWVTELQYALERRGARVWKDKNLIRPGDTFPAALDEGIDTSKAVVMVVTPVSRTSGWVDYEYNRARARAGEGRLQIIPALLPGVDLPAEMSRMNYVDFKNPQDFERSVDRILWPGATNKRIDVIPLAQSPTPEWTRLTQTGYQELEGLRFLPVENLSRTNRKVLERYLYPRDAHDENRLVIVLNPFDGNHSPQRHMDFVFGLRDMTKESAREIVFVLYPPRADWWTLPHDLTPNTIGRMQGYFTIPQDIDDGEMRTKIRIIWNQVQCDLMNGEHL